MRSMTAYGQARAGLADLEVAVEIRTVNGRYLDVQFKGPKELVGLEAEIKEQVKAKIARGRVEVCLNFFLTSSDQYDLNLPLAENYANLASQARSLGFEGHLDLQALFQLPGVICPRPFESRTKDLEALTRSALEEALGQVVRFREREGSALESEFVTRLDRLAGIVQEVKSQASDLTGYYREKLKEKLRRLGEQKVVEETRLAQEVIFHAERADISEELTRLASHIDHFKELLNQELPSLGKNLDFLCQEMNREMNTILSKASLAAISSVAVSGKVEIERIREQVQNVE